MSPQHGIVKQPAGDLSAFDVSKQSPAEIAQLFVLWKERRKRLNQPQAPARAARPARPKPLPAIARNGKEATAAEPEEKAARPRPSGAAAPIRYSDSFAAVLATRDARTFAQKVWDADARLAPMARPHPPRRRSRAKWILAGAASVLAVTAASGAVLWQDAAWNERQPGRIAAIEVAAPTGALEVSALAEPWKGEATSRLLPGALAAPAMPRFAERATLDAALLSYAPSMPRVAQQSNAVQHPIAPKLKPPVPIVTASEPAAATKASEMASIEVHAVSKAPVQQSEFAPAPWGTMSVAVPPEPSADASAAVPPTSQPPALYRRGNDKVITFNTNKHGNHGAVSGKPAAAIGKPSGASGGGAVAGGGAGAGGSSGGAAGPGDGGASAGSGAGGSVSGGANGSDGGTAGGGPADGGPGGDGGQAGGGPGDGGAGSSDGGGSGGGSGDGAGGGDSGGDGAGSGGAGSGGDTGGDTGGDQGGSDGADSGGGLGGAVDGAVGAVGGAAGDAVGGALGGLGGNEKDKNSK